MNFSGMRTDGLIRREDGSANTAVCNLILSNDGGLIAGIADMDIAESITAEEVSFPRTLSRSRLSYTLIQSNGLGDRGDRTVPA
jgi:hypothetical protein